MDLRHLDSLASSGGLLLGGVDAHETNKHYEDWVGKIADWLTNQRPGTGLTAEWLAIGAASLVVGGRSQDESEAWLKFRELVRDRLSWIAKLTVRLGTDGPRTAGLGDSAGAVVPPDFERSVFLNCPFDPDFRALRDAAVFTLAFLGYHVRCALDTADGSRVRIEKLYDLIRSSRLGIHDLSRTALDDLHELPRFNMPLELGMYLGVKDAGGPIQKRKVALITSSKPYEYQKYISDVAGQDVVPHRDDPEVFSGVIRDWLASLTEGHVPSRSRVWEPYRQFRTELKSRCREECQSVDELTYRDFIRHVDEFCSSSGHELVVGGEQPITSPSRAQIATAIRGLSGGHNSFAILGKSGSGLSFMQTAGGGEEPFVLEVQEGSTDAHFLCVTPGLDLKGVVRALSLYTEDDRSWRDDFEWERMDIISRST